MAEPYYSDDHVQLWHGDMREILPALDITIDACLTDPPYGETSLPWDRWPDGWPALVAAHTSSMWCFGSMRMFLERKDQFAAWHLSQDVVWEKRNGSGFMADRFKRVHELVLHFYRGPWSTTHHAAVRENYHGPDKHSQARDSRTPHTGDIGAHHYEDDGTRLVRTVLRAPSVRGGLHPTEKPPAVLAPLIEYAVPAGGLVLDPFAGSGSTLLTARSLGRRSIGVEADERYCEAAATRLATPDLFHQEAAHV
ncbi:DNA adenine methyltransferase, phage-associated [Alloactinosynnema sp. L-07]|uniref:DNA-methyltransferase n=1 Tax=Alloactinosynnema sp. L-07 TaxID=1653480 RepID=UPI00065F0762|nr:site-specific DNA-methyltransferase [Alloactinosynnema sp. L-07]CRK59038.1 DNA adenine methyltransferase, phage-associated [Alloactinosynnema sp. L-07]